MSPSPWAEVPGARLAYTDRGEGEALVFVHGITLDRRMWEPQAPLAAKWRIVAPDLRGHGRSSPPGDAPFSHAADIAAFLDALGLERAALVGHCTGGRAAAQFAVEHPERVTALALLGTAVHGAEFGPELTALFASLVSTARERGMSAAIELWLGCELFERARRLPAVEAALQRIVRDFDGTPWLRGDPDVAPDPPTLARLGEVEAPALVMVGEHDHPDFHRIARGCAGGLPNAELSIVRGAGHLVSMEAPATVNAALEALLARAERRA